MNSEATKAEMLLQLEPELFEQYMLVALNEDDRLWYAASQTLCLDKKYNRHVNDFSNVAHYAIYRAIKLGREKLTEAGETFHSIPDGEIWVGLSMLSMDAINPIIAPEKVVDVYTQWITIKSKIKPVFAVATVKDIWRSWLGTRQTARILNRVKNMDGEGMEEALTAIRQVQSDLDGTEDRIVSISDMFEEEQPEVERFRLSDNPFKQLNEVLGGGFGRTEHSLFIAPSGGGKTVIACQLAVDLAMNGYRVLLISTEQAAHELMPRFISCASGSPNIVKKARIPFKLIKDGCNRQTFTTVFSNEQRTVANQIIKQLDKKLFVDHWKGGKSVHNIQSSLDRVNRELGEDGKIDVVILDWIGRVLAEETTDNGKLRLLYQSAATAMKDLAINNNIATISMAQAQAAAANKLHLDNDCIAECKSLHNEATVAIGISAVKAKDSTEADGSSSTYAQNQCFYCFKSRKSEAQAFMMRRNFGYQRFDKI